jgi:hypothetical protein
MSREWVTKSVKLTAAGLLHIATAKSENDFTFVVGRRTYSCPWFLADFLSPKVGRLHMLDPSVNRFEVQTLDPGRHFPEFLLLAQGLCLQLTENNRPFLASLACELGNYELFFAVSDPVVESTLSEFTRFFETTDFGDYLSEQAVEFIAGHFFALDNCFLGTIPVPSLHRVLSHPSLRVGSDDALCDFIISRSEAGASLEESLECLELLEHVCFEYMSPEAVRCFVGWTQAHDGEFDISPALWRAIGRRLVLPVTLPGDLNRLMVPMSLRATAILERLSRAHRGNLHDQKIVTVRASSTARRCEPKDILASDRVFTSGDKRQQQWLCFDFNDREVFPTAYSINSNPGPGLGSWVIEGSMDGSNWFEMDRRQKPCAANARIEVQEPLSCRAVRLRQTGLNQQGTNVLCLSRFEIYGTIRDSPRSQ